VAWEIVCLPKSKGGLGLRDPKTLSQTLGAKIWWRWITKPQTQWESFWKTKYAQNQQVSQIIRMNNAPMGSSLWNLAWHNRHLIQENCFWEIKNGKDALFWEDAWKQLPRWTDQLSLLSLQLEMTKQNKTRVAHYWTTETNPSHWRKWLPPHQWTRAIDHNTLEGFLAGPQQKENKML
jgi:hypothetical protein